MSHIEAVFVHGSIAGRLVVDVPYATLLRYVWNMFAKISSRQGDEIRDSERITLIFKLLSSTLLIWTLLIRYHNIIGIVFRYKRKQRSLIIRPILTLRTFPTHYPYPFWSVRNYSSCPFYTYDPACTRNTHTEKLLLDNVSGQENAPFSTTHSSEALLHCTSRLSRTRLVFKFLSQCLLIFFTTSFLLSVPFPYW